MAHLDDPVERLPDVDPGLMDVLMEALDDDPAARPTAATFRDRLAALPLGAPATPVLPQLDEPLVDQQPRSRPQPPVPAPVPPAEPVASPTTTPSLAALAGPGGGGSGAAARGGARRRGRRAADGVGGRTRAGHRTVDGRRLQRRGQPVGRAPRRVQRLQRTVGRPAQCAPDPPQCWGSLTSAFDSLTSRRRPAATADHVYQTFAAGTLATPAIRQSQIDADAGPRRPARRSWSTRCCPPAAARRTGRSTPSRPRARADDDAYFRCVFGRGERDEPLTLRRPSRPSGRSRSASRARSQARSARWPSTPPGVSTTTGAPASRTTATSASGSTWPSPRLVCRSAPGAGGVAGVVGVDEVDPPGDGADPVDQAVEVLAGGVRVAGVEAEADPRAVPVADGVPELVEPVEVAGHGVVAAGRVLDEQRDLEVEPLDALAPVVDAQRRVVGLEHVTAVHHEPGGADLGGRVQVLLQELAARDADPVVRRRDVQHVRGVDVERDPGVGRRPCAAPRRRPRRRPAAPSTPAGRPGRTGRARRHAPGPPRPGRPGRRALRPAGPSWP